LNDGGVTFHKCTNEWKVLKLRGRGVKETCKGNIPFAKGKKDFDLWVIVKKKRKDTVAGAHREGWSLIL
jgi:hypothetical protein